MKWGYLLNIAALSSFLSYEITTEITVNDDPGVRIEQWGGEDAAPNLTPGAKSMISRMTNLNPVARPTIDEVLRWNTTKENGEVVIESRHKAHSLFEKQFLY